MTISKFKKYAGNLAIKKDMLDMTVDMQDTKDGDFVIAVMDRGWVFVGFMTKLPNSRIRLDCTHVVHRWGTSKGLGEIAIGGPTKETVLHEAGTIYGSPIILMNADIDKW